MATCSKFEGNSALIQLRRAPESGWAKGKISPTCPAGSDLISCNTYTPWHRSPTNGLGVISGRTCSANCAKTADGEGCAIYAQCFSKIECLGAGSDPESESFIRTTGLHVSVHGRQIASRRC